MNAKNTQSDKFPSYENGFKVYEEGKHRRYELLFAVNGGAFIIAKLFADKDVDAAKLGFLDPGLIALAMIVFTIVMGVDIYWFGIRMHAELDGEQQQLERTSKYETFGDKGRWVLFLIIATLALAWGLLLAGRMYQLWRL
jgi:hypothetical protein